MEVDRELISQALSRLAFRQEIMVEEPWDQEAGEEQRAVYLTGFYLAETNAAKRLKMLLQTQQQSAIH